MTFTRTWFTDMAKRVLATFAEGFLGIFGLQGALAAHANSLSDLGRETIASVAELRHV